MNLLNGCIIAFSLYSRLPMPKVQWREREMRYAMCFFPLVGAVLGLCFAGVYYLLKAMGVSAVFTGAVLTAVPVVLTGGIHMDGFLDTVDARRSYQPPEKKLEILKDPRAGAFALMYGCLYFLISFAVWHEADAKTVWLYAAGSILSRALSGYSVVALKSARSDGLAASFQEAADKRRTVFVLKLWMAAAFVLLILAGRLRGLLAGAVMELVFVYYRRMAFREFGGITGDLAGYFLQVCELFAGVAAVLGGKLL